VRKTKKILAVLSDPKTAVGTVSHNFIYNAEAVGIDVTKIAIAFDKNDYYHFGYGIGHIQNILLLA
jgi:hypothetical protein